MLPIEKILRPYQALKDRGGRINLYPLIKISNFWCLCQIIPGKHYKNNRAGIDMKTNPEEYRHELIAGNKKIFSGTAEQLLLVLSNNKPIISIGDTIKLHGNKFFVRRGKFINQKNQKNLIRYYLETAL